MPTPGNDSRLWTYHSPTVSSSSKTTAEKQRVNASKAENTRCTSPPERPNSFATNRCDVVSRAPLNILNADATVSTAAYKPYVSTPRAESAIRTAKRPATVVTMVRAHNQKAFTDMLKLFNLMRPGPLDASSCDTSCPLKEFSTAPTFPHHGNLDGVGGSRISLRQFKSPPRT